MTLLELLQQVFNATEEQTTAFTKGMKENKIFTSSEENMDIRYGKLHDQHTATTKQLEEANALIEELKKGTKGNEALQQKVTAYETENAQLKAQLLKVENAADARVELLAAGAKPEELEYLMFWVEKDGPLEKGDDGKIKGLADKISAIKTQRPASFNGEAKKNILENKLPTDGGSGDGLTRETLLKKPYAERMKLYNDNPEAYKAAMGND